MTYSSCRVLAIVLLAGAPWSIGGCSSGGSEGLFGRSESQRLSPADFAGSEVSVAEGVSASVAPDPAPKSGTASGVKEAGSISRSSGKTAEGIRSQLGAPVTSAAPAVVSGEPVTVDSVVGQINGRPVIASEVLESLDGALRADAVAVKSAGEWRQAAARRIVAELRRRVVDELVLSEARRSLTPEQRQGLLRFLETIQGRLVSQQQGSSVAADELLRQQSGRGLREEAEDIRNQELIRFEIRQRVDPRVQVAWRDVKNEYERSFTTWNPPAEYTFRLIYLASENAAGVASITDALQSGKPFVDVAGMEANEFVRRDGGKLVRKHAGTQAEGEFSPTPELNSALRSLSVGQTLGPITFVPDPARPERSRTAWVHLEKIDTPSGTPLYDAQLEINAELTSERKSLEEQRYLERLFKRGNVSSMESMGEKLLTVATDRYAPRFKQNR